MQLVSIIIPVYNSGLYLKETIDSAINQTWPEKEIIIIDDGSTDNSTEIISQYIHRGIIYNRQENKGASAARNKGLDLATGKYIQFLDSDDVIDKFKIEKQVKLLSEFDDSFIASGKFLNFTGSISNHAVYSEQLQNRDYDDPFEWLLEAAEGKAMFPPLVWLTPRNIIDKTGGWNESLSYNDDPEFFARILLKSPGIKFCGDSVSYYRRGVASSLGSRKDREARQSELRSLNLVTEHLLNHENSLRAKEACALKYRKFIYSLYPDHQDIIEETELVLKQLGVRGSFNFGKGLTGKLGKVIGWKRAKNIRNLCKSILK